MSTITSTGATYLNVPEKVVAPDAQCEGERGRRTVNGKDKHNNAGKVLTSRNYRFLAPQNGSRGQTRCHGVLVRK